MAKEDFLINSIKERIITGLKTNYLGHVTNREQLTEENNKTLEFLKDENQMIILINQIINQAKMELQNVGKIPGIKEILEIVDINKARNYAVDYFKTQK